MGNMNLVTGFRNSSHVTAADAGSLNAAIFGTGMYVLNRGSKLNATVISSNTVRIADGDILLQGRHVRINEGSTVDLSIDNGSQGYKRNDLIVARYTKDSGSGVEDVNLVVIKGTPSTSSPSDPAYNNADIINDHALIADMPLFRIPIDGITVGSPVALYSLATISIADGSITQAKIAINAVNSNRLAAASVTEQKIASGAVTADKIGSSAVSSAKIANGAVTPEKLSVVYEPQLSDAQKMRVYIGSDAPSLADYDIWIKI